MELSDGARGETGAGNAPCRPSQPIISLHNPSLRVKQLESSLVIDEFVPCEAKRSSKYRSRRKQHERLERRGKQEGGKETTHINLALHPSPAAPAPFRALHPPCSLRSKPPPPLSRYRFHPSPCLSYDVRRLQRVITATAPARDPLVSEEGREKRRL
jgi:hypothetical protein